MANNNFTGPGPATAVEGNTRDIFNNVIINQRYGPSLTESRKRQPVIYKVKHPVTSFTGRQNELKEIQQLLQCENEEASVSTSASTFAVIIGVGGTGKTELARKYAKESSDYYTNIVWFDSESSGTIRSAFETLANELGINGNISRVYEYLSQSKTLLIFDNAEGYETVEQYLPSLIYKNIKNIHILFTSQLTEWEVMDEYNIEKIHLNDLLPEDAKEFVKKSMNQNDVHDEDIQKLVEELVCFPLALTQAVAYINQQHQNSLKLRRNEIYGIRNYLKELRSQTKKLLDHVNTIHHRYANTVFRTIELTFEKLSKENNGKEAVHVLEIIAYLAPDDIDMNLMFKVDDNTVLLLDKYSMIKVIEGVASIHRLLQQVIRLRNEDKEIENLKKALTAVSINNGRHENTYLNHVMFVWSYVIKHKFFIQEATSYTYGGRDYSPLHIFVMNSNLEAIDFITANFPVDELKKMCNFKDRNGHPPLHAALQYKSSLNIVKLLMKSGSEVLCDTLHMAVACDANLDVVQYLVKNGADVNSKNLFDEIPLHLAHCHRNLGVVKYLIKAGSKINARDIMAATPLHSAVFYIQCVDSEKKSLELVKFLIQNGADVNAKDKYGETPLQRGSDNVALYLIENGADIHAKQGRRGLRNGCVFSTDNIF